MTLRARTAFRAISTVSCALPEYARTSVNEAYLLAETMYQSFNSSATFKDFGATQMAQMRKRLSFLEETASNLTKYVYESTPMQWLVSNQHCLTSFQA